MCDTVFATMQMLYGGTGPAHVDVDGGCEVRLCSCYKLRPMHPKKHRPTFGQLLDTWLFVVIFRCGGASANEPRSYQHLRRQQDQQQSWPSSNFTAIANATAIGIPECAYEEDGFCDANASCAVGSDVIDCSEAVTGPLQTTARSTLTRGGCHCDTSWTVSEATCVDAGTHSGCSMTIPCDGDDGGVPGAT